ncbi:MAG: apolipoprotein N-acyltransferase [Bacteroidia bacterium]
MKKQFLLILLSPLILTIGWPPLIMGFLLLIGFVPLLILEQEAQKWFGLKIYFSLLLWNIGTTWWVWNASPEGCIAMLLANTGLMLLPFVFYRIVKKHFGVQTGLTAWIISWVAMEYLHLNWEIAYPWLNLGNGLATIPQAIQWYEYTGTLGGTLWILVVNALVFKIYLNGTRRNRWMAVSFILIPFAFSYAILISEVSIYKGKFPKVLVVQPNVDPYQKFETEDPKGEVNYFIKMAETQLDSNTEFVLYPETGFTQNCDEAEINNSKTFILLREWLKKYPKLTLVSGTNTYRFFDSVHKTSSSRKYGNNKFYDIYNSAIVMNDAGVNDIYRKSKLVPGVEKMPYTQIFSFLENYAINLGGISGSLGEDTVARVFYSKNKIGAAPLICYESIFGEYVSEFVNNGAGVIFILTNDGWWGNTPGYRHHKLYARLRAIETRREVVRCTNTGISCIISKTGQISGETPWWQAATMTYDIHPSTKLTFYTQFGDYIGKMAALLFGIVLIMSIAGKSFSRKIFS